MDAAYLVQYGRAGFVGWFRLASADALARGDRAVIHGPRGLELGTVLCEPTGRFVSPDTTDGDLLRPASIEDEALAAASEARGQELLAAADEMAAAAGLCLTFVDVEVSLDGIAAVLHTVPWGACDATPVLAALSDRFGLAVRLLDLSRGPTTRDEPEHTGCGKPGCGSESGGCSSCESGGGGCSTGSCSRGKVKSAGELSAYFADLRQKMEAQAAARTPLG